jgi:PAS domain S-box-containing protein
MRRVRPDASLRLLVVRDVTERNRRFQEQLQLAAIVEASSDAIGSLDAAGLVTRWNRAAQQLFGFDADEIHGTSFVELFPDRARAAIDDALARALAGDVVRRIEVEATRRVGEDVDLAISLAPLRDDDGAVSGVAVVARDVTDQRRLERERARFADDLQVANRDLEHANQVRTEFVSMASHELRTPLTTIHGFATTMLDMWSRLPDDDKRRYIGIIDEQALRLSRLVDNLLTASKFESGRIPIRPRTYRVRDELERVIDQLPLDQLELRCDPDVTVTSDPDHLDQILVNLLVNAHKYGEPPYVVEVDSGDRQLTLRVCDSGPGVDEAFVPELFERFTRSPDATAREVEGAGLGLAIVRWLAEETGGRAWYEPNTPTGACFCIQLHDFSQAAGPSDDPR